MKFLHYLIENYEFGYDSLEHAYKKYIDHYNKHESYDEKLKSNIADTEKKVSEKYLSTPIHQLQKTIDYLNDVHEDFKNKYHTSTNQTHKNIYARLLNHVKGIQYKLSLKKSQETPPEESETYHGKHSAPGIEGNAPLHDLTHNGIYPDDVYSKMHQYRSGDDSDFESMSVISSAKNRPNKMVKIYRAIPDNLTAKDRANKISKKMQWMVASHKKPADANPNESWDAHYAKLKAQHDHELATAPEGEKPIKINPGDWVSISKRYAIDHGKDNLGGNYKIISKTVPAKHLHTDGNSFAEWGYNPEEEKK